MIGRWKQQFSWKDLSLEYENPKIFIVSQWQKDQKPSIVYLLYRWVIAIIFLSTIIISIIDLKYPDAEPSFKAKWLIYLTNWGYTTCTLQALLAAIMLSICVLAPYLRSKPNLESSALRWYKAYWVLNVIARDIAFGITTLYWSLLYNEKTMDLDAMNIFMHADNSVLMMLDLFMGAHPVRLLHCCYPIIFGICYTLFSVIFYAAGGISREGKTYIYTILNWNKPGRTIGVCFAVLAFLIIVHIITWFLYKLRTKIHTKCLGNPKTIEDKELDDGNKNESIKTAYVNEALANELV